MQLDHPFNQSNKAKEQRVTRFHSRILLAIDNKKNIRKFVKSRNDKNNVYDVKYINAQTITIPLDLTWRVKPKKPPKGAYFH